MKICEVLKEEEVNMTIDSMFRMLCLGLIGREKFMGAVLFAKSCGFFDYACGVRFSTLGILDSSNRYGLVCAFISKFYKSGTGQDLREPLATVTTSPGHFGLVQAYLIKYYNSGDGQDIKEPLDTLTTRDRFGLVEVYGTKYQVVDIGLRMLEPREQYNCQGFPNDYIIDRDYSGKSYSRSEQVKRCGNAVCPPIPAALVRANLLELCLHKRG